MQKTIHRLSRPHSLGAMLAAAMSAPALAGTILVPQHHATIQGAINASTDGDTIIVADGVYSGAGNHNIDLLGKAITVRSASGPAACTIDASGDPAEERAGFMLNGVQSAQALIDGFTVTGGDQFNGGGIYIGGGSPTVQNCVFTGNHADCWGGGVYCESGSSPTIRDCRIIGNDSEDDGGGLFTIYSSAMIDRCIIANNTARFAAGVCAFGTDVIMTNCRITNNTASYAVGGLYVWQGSMVNCTVAGNSAVQYGAGVYFAGGGAVTNSIVYGNSGGDQVTASSGVTFCLIQGGFAGEGNFDANPMFVNAAAGNYRLLPVSPAIDAGSSGAVPGGCTNDLGGNARIANHPLMPDMGVANAHGMVVDIGAFEYSARRVGGVMP